MRVVNGFEILHIASLIRATLAGDVLFAMSRQLEYTAKPHRGFAQASTE
jgi:hypothetical protein